MNLLAIDPGNEKSAYVIYDTCLTDLQDIREKKNIREFGIFRNEDLLCMVRSLPSDHLAIEMIACYGMAVGKTVFETCLWIGRFIEAYTSYNNKPFTKVYRMEVKMHLCNHPRAKDSNIRQAIMDRYEPTGGGKNPYVGTKTQPGPLYGVSKDVWAALGVAITHAESKCSH